jgi:T5orf172 domain
MRGYLYMISNKAMPGLLKIGYTTRSIEERISELHSTGVPSRFEKEFFRCPIKKAVEIVKLTICEGQHIFHGSGGRSASSFLTIEEQKEIVRIAEHNRIQKELSAQKSAAIRIENEKKSSI